MAGCPFAQNSWSCLAAGLIHFGKETKNITQWVMLEDERIDEDAGKDEGADADENREP